MSAWAESDSMMPEFTRFTPNTQRAIQDSLQLAINRKLMERLDELEKKVKELTLMVR